MEIPPPKPLDQPGGCPETPCRKNLQPRDKHRPARGHTASMTSLLSAGPGPLFPLTRWGASPGARPRAGPIASWGFSLQITRQPIPREGHRGPGSGPTAGPPGSLRQQGPLWGCLSVMRPNSLGKGWVLKTFLSPLCARLLLGSERRYKLDQLCPWGAHLKRGDQR